MMPNNTKNMKKIFCALLLWCVFLIPFRQVFAQSGGILTPFGGHIVDVDYETCDCGFIIYTVYDITTKKRIQNHFSVPAPIFGTTRR
jgi:hypothetical protein